MGEKGNTPEGVGSVRPAGSASAAAGALGASTGAAISEAGAGESQETQRLKDQAIALGRRAARGHDDPGANAPDDDQGGSLGS